MPHSSRTGELLYDLEIEKRAHSLRKETKKRKERQTSTASLGLNLATELGDFSSNYSSDSELEEIIMANNGRTLRELAASDINQQPLCITFPDFAKNVTFKLKLGTEASLTLQTEVLWLAKPKKQEKEREILEMFRRVEINIPLLDTMKQVLRYAQFLKDLYVNRKKLKGGERITVGENVPTVLQRKLPPKCGGLDFYIFYMGDERSPNPTPILLGRPFLSTTRTRIDVNEGTLTMEFDREEVFELDDKDELEVTLIKHLELESTCHVDWGINLKYMVETLQSLVSTSFRYGLAPIFVPETHQKLLLSIVQASIVELKSLPNNLKYAYLGEKDTLLVINSTKLFPKKNDKLIRVLRDRKKAFGWTIVDNKGINPSLCMHRIRLEEDVKPVRQPQRRLNPQMMKVVKKEILKLLDVRIIFAISDSPWSIEVDKAKIDVVSALLYPATMLKVRSFFGHAGFYQRFIQNFSKNGAPLFKLLQKDVGFEFNEEYKKVYDKLKELLTSSPIIQPPNWSLPFDIMCDASDYAIGAVLGQRVGKVAHVIYYASRVLNGVQLNYSTTEKEFLAVIFTLEKFRSVLLRAKVIICSDHAYLRYLLTKNEVKPSLIRLDEGSEEYVEK
ncbi:uncharacterized protein [Coffea arabica]|uniref:Reverse transcriptase/retrotransposon-derived protein RNase H-like domain-containing protein n=1 Tax=Coffea arabica TaxID=13443 RepID=A0ABM4VU73_COFAR